MKIQVEVTSREFVKPSSPTPHQLRHLYFSFFDHLLPNIHIPFAYFYSGETAISDLAKCNLLKKSLPQVLTLFYPLAGRIRNNSYADCNDEGFFYVEARASCKLSDVLRERNPNNNDCFTLFRPDKAGDLGGFAQITLFECGGLAISFAISHKLGDGLSSFIFINSWAAMARGDSRSIATPSFSHAAAFPPTIGNDYGPTFFKEKLVTKSFVFDCSSIDSLKVKYNVTKGNGRQVSSLKVIIGLIAGRYIATTRANKGNARRCVVMHTMNMRPRVEPRMPTLSFGNISAAATTEAEIDVEDKYGFGIAEKMRDSVTNYIEYFKRHDLDQVSHFHKAMFERYNRNEVASLFFTSLNKFPMYETDFGWGKPLWVGTTPIFAQNQVYLLGTRDGKGIEAWICLKEEEMTKFEADNHILPHALPNMRCSRL